MLRLFGFALLLWLLPGLVPAAAHSEFERAEPAAGSTLRSAPREVAIWFSQRLEPALSSITVRNAAGQRVDAGKAQVSGNVMRVPLKAIGPGSYKVDWRVLSVDTHRTRGNFSFKVAE
jgi:methionine-rich copper-binding protein CopC